MNPRIIVGQAPPLFACDGNPALCEAQRDLSVQLEWREAVAKDGKPASNLKSGSRKDSGRRCLVVELVN
jgi:hypothetical protein